MTKSKPSPKSRNPNEPTVFECHEKLTRIEAFLYDSNGDGVKGRLIRIEEAMKATASMVESSAKVNDMTAKISQENAVAIASLTKDVGTMNTKMEVHHAKPHFLDILKKIWLYPVILVFAILFHYFLTYSPVWIDWLLAIFKLPPLPQPPDIGSVIKLVASFIH